MLEVQNVSYRYNNRSPLVLDDVCLKLSDGEIGILLGKNGSGKTTLLKTVLGILSLQNGSVSYDGRALSSLSKKERAACVAYVPQEIHFGDLTVLESVLLGRIAYFGLRASQKDYDAVEEVLESMGIASLAHRNVNELSGGEKQKIAIARAIVQKSKLLIFDEPTGNLDIANEQLILKEAKKAAAKTGVSILSSLHDLNSALAIGDKFFLMKNGKIIYTVCKEELTEKMLFETYGVNLKIIEANNQKIILGGPFNES